MAEITKMGMSPKHLLLEMAKTYPTPARDLTPPGSRYDIAEGAWFLESDGTMLVESDNIRAPATKKHDIETGEDQKSE